MKKELRFSTKTCSKSGVYVRGMYRRNFNKYLTHCPKIGEFEKEELFYLIVLTFTG